MKFPIDFNIKHSLQIRIGIICLLCCNFTVQAYDLVIELDSVKNPLGFRMLPAGEGHFFAGPVFISAGDVNADGINDFIVGSTSADITRAG